MHRVEVAANNALDLRGAVFDAMLLTVMPPSEEVDVGRTLYKVWSHLDELRNKKRWYVPRPRRSLDPALEV